MDYATSGDRLLKIPEVAERLNLKISATYRLVQVGRLRAVVVAAGGRGLRVRASDLDEFIAGLSREPVAVR